MQHIEITAELSRIAELNSRIEGDVRILGFKCGHRVELRGASSWTFHGPSEAEAVLDAMTGARDCECQFFYKELRMAVDFMGQRRQEKRAVQIGGPTIDPFGFYVAGIF